MARLRAEPYACTAPRFAQLEAELEEAPAGDHE
jgi:hypothetical protein